MHKKIIAALGIAGFMALSIAKVNYAMEPNTTQAYLEVPTEASIENPTSNLEKSTNYNLMAALVHEPKEEVTVVEEETVPSGALVEIIEIEGYRRVIDRTAEPDEDIAEDELVVTVNEETEATQAATLAKAKENTAYLDSVTLAAYDALMATSGRVVNVTDVEYNEMLRIVEAEATGRDVLAKMLVAGVVLNRVNSTGFPNTIEGVIFQTDGNIAQFSPIDDGRYYSVTVTDTTIEAVNRVLMGEDYSMGSLYFAAEGLVDSTGCWASRHFKEMFRYGGHVFFAN